MMNVSFFSDLLSSISERGRGLIGLSRGDDHARASVMDLVRLDLQDIAEGKGATPLASAQENLALGREAALKLRDRIEEVLEVRRIEEGELVLAREHASLIELVRDAAATLEGEARRAGVALELSVSGACAALRQGSSPEWAETRLARDERGVERLRARTRLEPGPKGTHQPLLPPIPKWVVPFLRYGHQTPHANAGPLPIVQSCSFDG